MVAPSSVEGVGAARRNDRAAACRVAHAGDGLAFHEGLAAPRVDGRHAVTGYRADMQVAQPGHENAVGHGPARVFDVGVPWFLSSLSHHFGGNVVYLDGTIEFVSGNSWAAPNHP